MSDENKSRRRWWPFTGPVGGSPLPLNEEQWVDRIVARGIYRIGLVAVLGIITMSILGTLARVGILTDSEPITDVVAGQADEAFSILGNIGSACIGALAGWWSRGLLDRTKEIKSDSKQE